MPKPPATYRAIKGKTKTVAEAKAGKANATRKPEDDPHARFEALLKARQLDGPKLEAISDMLERVAKKSAEDFDATTIGKIDKVVEHVRKLAQDVSQDRKTFAQIAQPARHVVELHPTGTTSGLDFMIALAGVCHVFLQACRAFRRKH